MSYVFTHADVYTGEEKILNGFIRFDKQIQEIGPMIDFCPRSTDKNIVDLNRNFVVPGFIDIHSHGGYGIDTMDAKPDKINKMVKNISIKEGVTSFFPTTVTQSNENIKKAILAVKTASKTNPIIQGIHLEGPFISSLYKGAQPKKFIQKPNKELLNEWRKLSGNIIRLITYAPEEGSSLDFEDYCLSHDIVPAAGHSNATRQTMKHSKINHVTHLFNAQRNMQHRQPGLTGHALLEENIYCELIADGFHVSPDMIKLAYELKGAKRIELVTDSMRAKGMPEGISELGGQKVIVKDKQARIENGNLAGSVLKYNEAFKNIMRFTGCEINEAVLMSSVNQAREFGLKNKGSLQKGKDADFNVLDKKMMLKGTYSMGKKIN